MHGMNSIWNVLLVILNQHILKSEGDLSQEKLGKKSILFLRSFEFFASPSCDFHNTTKDP